MSLLFLDFNVKLHCLKRLIPIILLSKLVSITRKSTLIDVLLVLELPRNVNRRLILPRMELLQLSVVEVVKEYLFLSWSWSVLNFSAWKSLLQRMTWEQPESIRGVAIIINPSGLVIFILEYGKPFCQCAIMASFRAWLWWWIGIFWRLRESYWSAI